MTSMKRSSLTSCCASSRRTAHRAAAIRRGRLLQHSRAASRRKRLPLLPAPSSTTHSTAGTTNSARPLSGWKGLWRKSPTTKTVHMSDASTPPEAELTEVPPALAFAPPMSNLELCIALRLVHDAGLRQARQTNCHLHHISASLSVVARVGVPA